ncbi:hypothetical protein Tco_1476776 [Tanacetum coccineum]
MSETEPIPPPTSSRYTALRAPIIKKGAGEYVSIMKMHNLKFSKEAFHRVACIGYYYSGQPGLDELDFDELLQQLKGNRRLWLLKDSNSKTWGASDHNEIFDWTKEFDANQFGTRGLGDFAQGATKLMMHSISTLMAYKLHRAIQKRISRPDAIIDMDALELSKKNDVYKPGSKEHYSFWWESLVMVCKRQHRMKLVLMAQKTGACQLQNYQQVWFKRQFGLGGLPSKNIQALIHPEWHEGTGYHQDTQHRASCKKILCDHGTDFKNQLINLKFCATKGIKENIAIAASDHLVSYVNGKVRRRISVGILYITAKGFRVYNRGNPRQSLKALADESWVEASQEELLQLSYKSGFVKRHSLYGNSQKKCMSKQPSKVFWKDPGPAHPNKFYREEITCVVQVYVVISSLDLPKSSMVKYYWEDHMQKDFKMSSMGELTFFLGLQVKQCASGCSKILGNDEEGEELMYIFTGLDWGGGGLFRRIVTMRGKNHDRRSTSEDVISWQKTKFSWQMYCGCKIQLLDYGFNFMNTEIQ